MQREFFFPNRIYVRGINVGCLFCTYGRNRMGTLRRNWIRVIYLLSGALLVLIIGTLGAYWLWRAPAVLAFGGAVAVPLARALLKAVQKFR